MFEHLVLSWNCLDQIRRYATEAGFETSNVSFIPSVLSASCLQSEMRLSAVPATKFSPPSWTLTLWSRDPN